jgi:DNA polymerase eta
LSSQIIQDPERLKDRPVGVVQYNPYGDLKTLAPHEDRLMNDSNGSLIAVNYAARAAGVKRNHRGSEARALCPDLQLVQVPVKHGKADLTPYRNAGKQVLKILGEGNAVKVERASIDECYLDLTEEANKRLAASGGMPDLPVRSHQVHLYGTSGEDNDNDNLETWWSREAQDWGPGERSIAAGAAIVAELREKVENILGYTCSAGIAPTRLLAKLCSGLHKPSQQTVVPASSVSALLSPLPLNKVRGLGGQFGRQVATDLNIETVGQLAAIPLNKLETVFGEKDGRWLFGLARGIDDAEVEERRLAKSVSCGKTFRGGYALKEIESVHTWLLELAAELEERLLEDKEDNKRTPQLLTVSVGAGNDSWGIGNHFSRSCAIRRVEAAALAEDAAGLVKRWANEQPTGWRITDLFLGVSSFVDVQTTAITQFFKPAGGTDGVSPAVSPMPQKTAKEVGTGSGITEEKGGEKKVEQEIVVQPTGIEGSGTAGTAGAGGSRAQKTPRIAPSVIPSATAGGGGGGGDGKEGGVEYIDESVFAELPLEIQRELRTAMKFEAMQARAGSGGGGGRNRNSNKTTKRPANASQKTLKDLFHGKRPKK